MSSESARGRRSREISAAKNDIANKYASVLIKILLKQTQVGIRAGRGIHSNLHLRSVDKGSE